MKRYFTLCLCVGFAFAGGAQSVNTSTLDLNNADALITDGGVFFNNESSSSPGLAIPSGSQLNTVFSMAFWYGGLDVNGQLKLSAQEYENFADQWTGPLTVGSGQTTSSTVWAYQQLFSVTKAEIVDFQNNYMNPGYVVPNSISSWPAHGDISEGYDYYLAPFVDVDGDGIYDPHNDGDYPCIRGDQAIYLIMNDAAYAHASGGDPIGLEMHYMFYEYDTQLDDRANTIFVHGKLINRGTQTLYDFKTSVFMDADIGNSADDYFGSDSTRNLMCFYNGDNVDETTAFVQGYGENPPAAGIVSLSQDFESIGLIDGDISTAAQYWYLMNGNSISGAPWTNPVTSNPTSFVYSSDPMSTTAVDSEQAQMNPPGERRGLATLDFGTLQPAQEREFDFAVIYNRNGGNNIQHASELRLVADNIQQFADSSFANDCFADQGTIGIEPIKVENFSIHPNPSNGQFTLAVDADLSNVQAKITDLTGRVVMDVFNVTSAETQIQVNEPAGVYFLQLSVDGRESVKRIVLK